jgi:hypothetical protein
VLLEHLHEAGKVEQGTAEPIDLVDDHGIDLAGLDDGQEAAQGRRSVLPPVKPPSS